MISNDFRYQFDIVQGKPAKSMLKWLKYGIAFKSCRVW